MKIFSRMSCVAGKNHRLPHCASLPCIFVHPALARLAIDDFISHSWL